MHVVPGRDTLGYESLDTPKKFIQTRRTLFCFYSRLDNNQGGCQHFHTQVYLNVKNAMPVLKYFREITVTDDVSLTCGLQTFVQ